jgi:16S rRNA (cytosine1402-N4)-methyltransferase
MNKENHTTAADLLRELSADELTRIFQEYGEERFARRIARRIEQERVRRPLLRASELVGIVDACVPGRMHFKSLSRIFQALRIAVNDELAALKDFLAASFELLSPNGVMAIISYHSLEDREVKTFFREKARGCVCPPELPVCTCGHKSELSILTRKAIQAGEDEVRSNPRARSARLRMARKRGVE